MKNLKFIVCSFLLFFAVVSCKSTKPTVKEKEVKTTTITETLHDTVFKTQIDSSSYKALLECQNGKVIIKSVTQAEPGRILKSPKVRVDNNELNVDCEARAQELFAYWKSTQVSQIEYREVPKLINELTFWQEFQIKGFCIFSLLTLLLIIWLIIKSYFKV